MHLTLDLLLLEKSFEQDHWATNKTSIIHVVVTAMIRVGKVNKLLYIYNSSIL